MGSKRKIAQGRKEADEISYEIRDILLNLSVGPTAADNYRLLFVLIKNTMCPFRDNLARYLLTF